MTGDIITWLDKIAAVWAAIPAHQGAQVRTVQVFRTINRAEFPETVPVFPCVLTYPTSVNAAYGSGSISIDLWTGRSDFFLFPSVERKYYPALFPYFQRIKEAAAASVTLGGAVEHFLLQETNSMEGPVELTYGNDEAPMLGITVNWEVKVVNPVTVSP